MELKFFLSFFRIIVNKKIIIESDLRGVDGYYYMIMVIKYLRDDITVSFQVIY